MEGRLIMNRNRTDKNVKVNKAIEHVEPINSFDSLDAHKPVPYKEPIHIKEKKNENDSFS